VVEEVRRVTGAELSVRHGPAKAGEMPAVIVDPGRARAAGFSPQWSFNEGIEAVWQEWSGAGVDGAVAVPGSGR
jgi:UDP-glucose 4-epimerase